MTIESVSRPPEDPARPALRHSSVGQSTVSPRPFHAESAQSLRSRAEATLLSARARLVPESLLAPPFTNERRGILHDQAAALLNRYLRRLARMRNPVELRIARLLGRMKRLSSYLDLGFARMTDYAVERHGLSVRRTQVLLQIDDGLRELPATALAYESGRLSHSQVLLLLRVATAATETLWLEKAASMNVRKLEKEVRRVRGALTQESAGASSPANPSDTAASETVAVAPGAPMPAPGALTPAAPAMPAPAVDRPLIDDDIEEPLMQLSFPAPDRVRGQWDWAVEVFRRTAGAVAPVWQAAEGIAAEYLSGLPQLPAEGIGMIDDDTAAEGENRAAGFGADATPFDAASPDDTAGFDHTTTGVPDSTDDDIGLELFEEVRRAIEDELGISKWAPSADDMEVTLPRGLDAPDPEEDAPGDAASLDHRLRGLIDIRQNLAWHQGRLLRTFANYRLYRSLGFQSFSRYCRENLGMSVRRARRLIALARRLLEMPDLERAYRNGELSWVKASEIARVARPETEKAWIHLGRSVTARRLREEVALAAADMENDALPWDARRGLPRGLTPDGRVQLCAPSIQPPPDPGSAPGPDSSPTAAAASPSTAATSPADAGVQTSAPPETADPMPDAASSAETSPTHPAPFPADPGVQTSARSDRITTRIHFRAPADVAQLWRQTLAACRAVNGDHLQDWECVVRMLESFRRTWDLRGSAAWRRRYRIFERDGWRCRVPGCSSRRNLQAHHIVFRSEGGSGEDDNLVSVCVTHHLRCLHAGSLRCHRLPDGLLAWEFGAAPGAGATERFVEDVLWKVARDTPTTGQAGAG